jgi:hypothetical protein
VCSILNIAFPISIETELDFIPSNAEPLMNWTFRGISIDLSDENENDFDSIRSNCEFDSNEIDESDVQCEKHDYPRISISAQILTDDDDEKFLINRWLTL